MRETSFSILKGIAIILVVLSHAGTPSCVNNFISLFHVPAFFFCAGYFFSERNLSQPGNFLFRRARSLYFPFLKWSLLFLILHNLFFATGLLSETYGNSDGGVLHPYGWTEFFQRTWDVVFNMSGYDAFICAPFWFFRTLFIASVAFLVAMLLFRKLRPADTLEKNAGLVAATVFLLIVWKIGAGLKITGVAGGGYRELLGVLFMSGGFLFSHYKDRIPANWVFATGCLLVTLLGAVLCPTSMSYTADFTHFLALLLPAAGGFGLLYYISQRLDRHENMVKQALVYVGERTLYVFVFHIIAFKLVSLVKIAFQGLPWEMMGCHPVIPSADGELYWVLYFLTGVLVPLGGLALYRHYAARIDLSYGACARYTLNGFIWTLRTLAMIARKAAVATWRNLVSGWHSFTDILKASSPKDE